MNREHLLTIFNEYIKNFETTNNKTHTEYMKWQFAKAFSEFDIYTTNLAQELKRLKKISSVLIDGSRSYPFGAIITYAENEPETVRQLFLDLFAEDNGDFSVRQQKIDSFIEMTESLRSKYHLGSLSKNDQRSAMAFLFFRNPDTHYLYKANQAYRFANCIEFYDDWGAMSHFNMSIYYRMCDWLVEEIKKYPPLLETSASRYGLFSDLHPDAKYHILAFDIIYCSQVYGFYRGMNIKPIDANARKLAIERTEKAKNYLEQLKAAEEAQAKLANAKQFINEHFSVGEKVHHKAWKNGTIESVSNNIVGIHFEAISEIKYLVLPQAVTDGFLSLPEDAEQLKAHIEIIKLAPRIERNYKDALDGFKKYAEYLDE